MEKLFILATFNHLPLRLVTQSLGCCWCPVVDVDTSRLMPPYCSKRVTKPVGWQQTQTDGTTMIRKAQGVLSYALIDFLLTSRILDWFCFSLWDSQVMFFTSCTEDKGNVSIFLWAFAEKKSIYSFSFPQHWCWGQVVVEWRERNVSHPAWPPVKAVHHHRQVLQSQRERQGLRHNTARLH